MARVYKRGDRWWGDFREFKAIGGSREPLIPPGHNRATMDRNLAHRIFAERLKELEATRDNVGRGRAPEKCLGEFAVEHLEAKRDAGKATADYLELQAVELERAVLFFGADTKLCDIGVKRVEEWIAALRLRPGRSTNRPLSDGTVRHHLNALSNLYRRAQSYELVPPGFNPVSALMEKPACRVLEARWLEVPEAARYLEAARRLPPQTVPNSLPFTYELIATLLLTGGRRAEILGLELEDVCFDKLTISIRPNRWRRVKTRGSARVVPIVPQLQEILRPYINRVTADTVLGDAPARRLLFPHPGRGPERMLHDIQKTLDRVAIEAGLRDPVVDRRTGEQRRDRRGNLVWKGTVTSKVFRHTYAAARLQTLDRGAPVSVYTVAQELGHGSEVMLQKIYGHLGSIRHRSEVVEYRIEQHHDSFPRGPEAESPAIL